MQNEKLQINLAPGMGKAELVLREGAAPKVLDPKPPVKINIEGVITAPCEYLKKRIDTGQFEQKDCHIIVNREEIEIKLVINEADEYQRREITGLLQYHPKFLEFGINGNKVWTPMELGLFVKMNRSFFNDKATNMELVTKLMNFTATVNNQIERNLQENGNRTDNFVQTVNSNLPKVFTLNIPIFKGHEAETLEVETFAKINGRDVSFMLLSPGAQAALEDLRDKAIDGQLKEIREIAPDIAIIEV